MFYVEKENKVVLFDETKQNLENTLKFMPHLKDFPIKETLEGYTVVDYEVVTVEEVENAKLQKAKTEKLQEALEKAYEYENKTGFVSIMGRPVENPEETKSLTIELFNQAKFFQLMIAFSQGLLTDDFVYSTKEDVNIFVNAEEAGQIYQTITEALSELWVENYPTYKALIDKAESVEEVEAIEIDYDDMPVIEAEAPEMDEAENIEESEEE